MTNESPTMIQVIHRFVKGYHVFTSQDVSSLYVASKDARKAFDSVPGGLKTILAYDLREKFKPEQIIVEATLTFSEFMEMVLDGDDFELALTDRQFSLKVA